MKTIRIARLFFAPALGSILLPAAWCADQVGALEPPAAPGNLVVVSAAGTGAVVSLPLVTGTKKPEVVYAQWDVIKDYHFEMRGPFLNGLAQLEARVDGQMSELDAKRAGMEGLNETSRWDIAMMEMQNARSLLKATSRAISHATAENWNQMRDKVGVAWARTQSAYRKVKSSTTI